MLRFWRHVPADRSTASTRRMYRVRRVSAVLGAISMAVGCSETASPCTDQLSIEQTVAVDVGEPLAPFRSGAACVEQNHEDSSYRLILQLQLGERADADAREAQKLMTLSTGIPSSEEPTCEELPGQYDVETYIRITPAPRGWKRTATPDGRLRIDGARVSTHRRLSLRGSLDMDIRALTPDDEPAPVTIDFGATPCRSDGG